VAWEGSSWEAADSKVTDGRTTGVHPPWRGEITSARRDLLLDRLAASSVYERRHPDHGVETTRIADQLGWAKTYDAEYVALASLLECRLVTLDGRLRGGADRLGLAVTPAEL